MSNETYLLDDTTWDELIDLTDGAIAVCFQCGVCTATCPWGKVKEDFQSVRQCLRNAQVGLQNGSEDIWLCTTCAQCEAFCPRGVDISSVFRGIRQIAWNKNQAHAGLPNMLWSVFWNNNPWEQPPSQRSQWAANLDVPIFNSHEHDILLYIGCTASYDTRAQKIAIALVKLFKAGMISFGILGEDEPCSGEEVLSTGNKFYFDEIAGNSVKQFKDRGVCQIITCDPHSFDVFANHYPSSLEVSHYTQFLAEQIELGKIVFKENGPDNQRRKVAFHDPCYLARHHNEVEAPRKILAAIPGLEVVEMANSGIDTICCGGGGGRMWIDTPVGERFSNLRVDEAVKCELDLLATACPYCISCLEDSVKSKNISDMVVLDVAELAASALG